MFFLSLYSTGQTVPVPSFQSHRESLDQDPNGSSRVCLPHSAILASTSLVSSSTENTNESSNFPPDEFLKNPDEIPHPFLVEEQMFLTAWQRFSIQGFWSKLAACSYNEGTKLPIAAVMMMMRLAICSCKVSTLHVE